MYLFLKQAFTTIAPFYLRKSKILNYPGMFEINTILQLKASHEAYKYNHKLNITLFEYTGNN